MTVSLKLTGPIIIEVTKILEMFYIILATKASSFPPQKCSCTDMKLSPLALSIPCQVYCCLSVWPLLYRNALVFFDRDGFFKIIWITSPNPRKGTFRRKRPIQKEHVASLIGLYKNNGAVSCVAINFLFIIHYRVWEGSTNTWIMGRYQYKLQQILHSLIKVLSISVQQPCWSHTCTLPKTVIWAWLLLLKWLQWDTVRSHLNSHLWGLRFLAV